MFNPDQLRSDFLASEVRAGATQVQMEKITHAYDYTRESVLAQIQDDLNYCNKERTDAKRLFDYCRRRAHETEFFIRKAIGWALRDYSYAEPTAVRDFLLDHRDRLSGLSFREGAKQLVRAGLIDKP